MQGSDGEMRIIPIRGLPEISEGAGLATILADIGALEPYDVLVVTQKIVSKAEGRLVDLAEEDEVGFEELVRRESVRVLRRRGPLLITETRHGFICANAGIDRSNMPEGTVALLPVDADHSARALRSRILHRRGFDVAVIITDTFGRTWRNGVTDVAIGIAGIAGVDDLRGRRDAGGRVLRATEVCVADEIASAAELVKPKDGGIPVVIVRGVDRSLFRESSVADEIVRAPSGDLFR